MDEPVDVDTLVLGFRGGLSPGRGAGRRQRHHDRQGAEEDAAPART